MKEEGRRFKKQYVNKQGELQIIDFKLPEKTINDELSEDINKTKELWTKQSIFTATSEDDLEKLLQTKKGKFFKYISRRGGKIQARMGGVLTKIMDNNFMLMNPTNGVGWSVQYKDVVELFETPKEKVEDEPESKRIERQLKKKQKELKKEEREKKKKEKEDKLKKKKEKKQEKEEEKAEEEAKKEPKPEKLTDEEANTILKKAYYEDDMKFGRDKLYATLKANGHNLTRKQVNDWLKKQTLYQLDKPVFEAKDFVTQTAKDVNNVWNIDLVEMDGDKIVLNCVDRFSKFAYSRILRNKTAKQVVNALKSIFRNDKPNTIISDNGPEFKSIITQDFLKDHDVKQFFSTPHQPQSNGLVENFNKQMKSIFKKMTYQKTDQKTTFTQPILNRILKAYNTSYHSVIDMTPTDAKKPENKADVLKANEKNVSVGMKTIQKDDLEKGDQVRVSQSKFQDKKTKQYRTNWSEEIFFIKQVMRGKGLKPIQYKLEDADNKSIKGLFKREELQSIKYTENEDKVDVPYEIDRFIQEQGDEIKVSYKGYKKDGDRWIEKRILKKDLGATVFKNSSTK